MWPRGSKYRGTGCLWPTLVLRAVAMRQAKSDVLSDTLFCFRGVAKANTFKWLTKEVSDKSKGTVLHRDFQFLASHSRLIFVSLALADPFPRSIGLGVEFQVALALDLIPFTRETHLLFPNSTPGSLFQDPVCRTPRPKAQNDLPRRLATVQCSGQ